MLYMQAQDNLLCVFHLQPLAKDHWCYQCFIPYQQLPKSNIVLNAALGRDAGDVSMSFRHTEELSCSGSSCCPAVLLIHTGNGGDCSWAVELHHPSGGSHSEMSLCGSILRFVTSDQWKPFTGVQFCLLGYSAACWKFIFTSKLQTNSLILHNRYGSSARNAVGEVLRAELDSFY